jgi:hypothetical protein
MAQACTLHAGDSIGKTLTFTLAAGEAATCVSLLLTRVHARSEHPAIGRARCIVLEANNAGKAPCEAPIVAAAASATPAPRERFVAELRGIIPASICGGTYTPVFCLFAYADGRPATAFEIDADQRFAFEVADDAAAVDAGPSISGFV